MPRNVSELRFEEYIESQQLGVPDHEPIIPGKSKRIDYRIPFEDQLLWFEVKEFAEDPGCFSHGNGSPHGLIADPYAGIRRKIDKAADKFREYDGECCSLLLWNRTLNLNFIYSASNVLGAMLGNVCFSVPMDVQKGIEAGPPNWVFTDGGKLINPHTKIPQKTRISAVIALEEIAVGQREFHIELAKRELAENRRYTWDEFFEFLNRPDSPYAQTALRVIVHENPFAAKRLPMGIFNGPFDVRWGPVDSQRINRIYVGPELARLEREEHELGLDMGLFKQRTGHPWEEGYKSNKRVFNTDPSTNAAETQNVT